jgi:hypothetical protein
MKKILALIILSALAINLNITAMQKKTEPAKRDQQTRLSKMDYAKIAAASVGALLCGWSALAAYPTSRQAIESPDDFISWKTGPAILMFVPLAVIFKLYDHQGINTPLRQNITFGLSGALSCAISGGLSWYVYKKLSQLKSNKRSESEKIAA